MVVRDLDVVGMVGLPSETDAVLVVDTDAILTCSLSSQPLEAVSWWHSEVEEADDAIQLIELPSCYGPQGLRAGPSCRSRIPSVEDVLGPAVAE